MDSSMELLGYFDGIYRLGSSSISMQESHRRYHAIFLGGDDLAWKAWDTRTDLSSPLFVNKRSFDGGVTSIQSHPYYEHYVAVG
ncbi:10074_t:CDS:2, partial [Acaulospora colombiana]